LRRADLKLLFDNSVQSNLMTWTQIDARWPAAVIEVALPRRGTKFADTFNELILGVTHSERLGPGSVAGEEALRVLQRVQRTVNGLTYLPYSEYLALQQRFPVRLIDIVLEGGAAVAPSRTSIGAGSYELARPLLLFVRRRQDSAAGLNAFVQLVLSTAERRLESSAFLPLSQAETKLALNVLLLRGMEEGVPPLEPSALAVGAAREILLQQVPRERRARERSKLEGN
jgi:ABC-type phosphate transport system substrate-binding protein